MLRERSTYCAIALVPETMVLAFLHGRLLPLFLFFLVKVFRLYSMVVSLMLRPNHSISERFHFYIFLHVFSPLQMMQKEIMFIIVKAVPWVLTQTFPKYRTFTCVCFAGSTCIFISIHSQGSVHKSCSDTPTFGQTTCDSTARVQWLSSAWENTSSWSSVFVIMIASLAGKLFFFFKQYLYHSFLYLHTSSIINYYLNVLYI